MSEKNESKPVEKPKKPTLEDLKRELVSMKRAFDLLPSQMVEKQQALLSKKNQDHQELQSARARLIKPAMEAKELALKAANQSFKTTQDHAQAEYEDEILPIKQRLKAKIEEAERDLKSKVESAKIEFNKAAEDLLVEHKQELDKLELKFKKDSEALEEAFQTEKSNLTKGLVVMEEAVRRETEKREAKKPVEKPAEGAA